MTAGTAHLRDATVRKRIARMTIQLNITGNTEKTWLRPRLRRLLNELRISEGAWNISIVNDAAMTNLHGRTLNLWTTTDVLTFDLRDAKNSKGKSQNAKQKTSNVERRTPNAPVELDTIICLDEARRRAHELRHTVREELLLYCLHSLLHVQGYDDITPAQSRAMHTREDQLLQAIGIGPVYSTQNTSRPKSKMLGGENQKSKIQWRARP